MKYALVICALWLGYARWIEPGWIEVTHHSIKRDLPRRLRIAHLTDLHIRSRGSREAKIQAFLKQENPDVILITGDSIAENANYEALNGFLAELSAPLGIWSVRGNWEHWRASRQNGKGAHPEAGIHSLNNSAEKIIDGVWVIGIDDELSGSPDLQQAMKEVPAGAFKIGLYHSPAFFDRSQRQFDLSLAGHTHGGQIRLPFFPPLWLPEGSGRFVSGWHRDGGSQMYVSRGLGNSIVDMRFWCRPELAIIEIGY